MTVTGIDEQEWDDLVSRAVDGVIHADDVAHVVRNVELTSEVLVAVRERLAAQGITIDEHVEGLDDVTPPHGTTAGPDGADEARSGRAGRLLGRRPKRRTSDSSESPVSATGTPLSACCIKLIQTGRLRPPPVSREPRLRGVS